MSNEYKPHLLEWTDEKVARFWNFRNNYKPYDETWFTEQAGSAVLKFVNKHHPLKGKILDYGTGKGFLVQHLLESYPRAEIYACDFTDGIAKEVDEKFAGKKAFKGSKLLTQLPSSYEADFFDVVFLIETIEHLTDNYLHSTFAEINRILKPGGIIVVTTPNDEALEKTFVHCADCGASFHHMQHIRSWNVKSLTSLASQFNFSTTFCEGIDIRWHGKNGFIHQALDRAKRIFTQTKKNNLVYIGQKK